MKHRALHERWVDAGRRRIVARALRAQGMTHAEIARLTGVSRETVRRDLRRAHDSAIR